MAAVFFLIYTFLFPKIQNSNKNRTHLDAESQCGCAGDGLPPDHISWLGHRLRRVLLGGGGVAVDLYHLVVHILAQLGLLLGLGQLLLQIGANAHFTVHHARLYVVTEEILELQIDWTNTRIRWIRVENIHQI